MRCCRARSIASRYASSATEDLLGHAVGAAEVAAVGHRDPQVANRPPERVGHARPSVEGRRLVGFDAIDHGRLVGVGVDLAGGSRSGGPLLGEALPAEREDGVGIEPVEGAQADHLVVSFAPDGPLVGATGERALQPRRIELDGDLCRIARALEPALLRRGEDACPGRHEFVEEGRQLGRHLDLDALPEPDLRNGRAGLGLLEVGRGRLEPAADRIETLGKRRVIPCEQEEEAVAHDVEGERASFPEPQDVRIEDGAADVVELELAFEGGLGRERRGIDRLDRCEMLAVLRQLGEDRLAAAVAQ